MTRHPAHQEVRQSVGNMKAGHRRRRLTQEAPLCSHLRSTVQDHHDTSRRSNGGSQEETVQKERIRRAREIAVCTFPPNRGFSYVSTKRSTKIAETECFVPYWEGGRGNRQANSTTKRMPCVCGCDNHTTSVYCGSTHVGLAITAKKSPRPGLSQLQRSPPGTTRSVLC